MEKMSIAEYAKLVKVTPRRVYAWRDEGKFSEGTLFREGGKLMLDVDRANADLHRTKDPARSQADIPEPAEMRQTIEAAGLDGVPDFQESKALHEHYKAALKKLEFDEKAGTLVKKEDVNKEMFECARGTRDALMAIPNRVASVLAAETDADAIKNRLDGEIRVALQQVIAMLKETTASDNRERADAQ